MGQMSCGYQCPSLRKWMIKTSHTKGFKPVFQTPELWLCTLSGWGASPISPAVCCRWCSLGNEIRDLGQDRHLSWHPRLLMQFMLQTFGCQHCHCPGQGAKPLQCHCPRSAGFALCHCPVSRCWSVTQQAVLARQKELGVCRCWYTCSNTFTVINVTVSDLHSHLTFSVHCAELILSWNARQRALPTACGGAGCIAGGGDGGDLGRRVPALGREGNWRFENTCRQGSPKSLFIHWKHEIYGSYDSPWMIFATLLHLMQKQTSHMKWIKLEGRKRRDSLLFK